MSAVMKLGGVDELLAELERLAPGLTTEAIALQQTIAQGAADELRAALPVASGELRASVRVQRESSHSPVRVFSELSVTAPYAHFVEFGTADTAPRPAFVPITRRARETFVKAVIQRVRDRGLVIGGA